MRYIYYHSVCYDGFSAAYVAWLKFGNENTKYIPIKYGEPLPPIKQFKKSDEVYILDFSFNRDYLIELNKRIKLLRVIDHHITAKEILAGLDFAIFDLEKSGATLAWKYFMPGKMTPVFLEYIQDRDLWTFDLLGSKEFSAALRIHPMDFDEWSIMEGKVCELVNEGKTVLKVNDMLVEAICKFSHMEKIGEYIVPTVNTPCLWSEIGDYMLKKYVDALFVASWYINNKNQKIYQLRSKKGVFDVGHLALSLGGGGHECASGFIVDIKEGRY